MASPATAKCETTKLTTCYRCYMEAPAGAKHQVCGACGIARYCSAACQKEDWKTHKKQCVDKKSETASMCIGTVAILERWVDKSKTRRLSAVRAAVRATRCALCSALAEKTVVRSRPHTVGRDGHQPARVRRGVPAGV